MTESMEIFDAAIQALRDLSEEHWAAAEHVAALTAEGIAEGKIAREAYEDALLYALDSEDEKRAFEEFRGHVKRSLAHFQEDEE